MRAFVINLDRAPDRWKHIENAFNATKFQLVRVTAVDGNALTLPHSEYNEARYHARHGRETNRYELACYLSHVEAMKAFLASGDESGLICEDDITLLPGLDQVVERAMVFKKNWNMLRLTALTSENNFNAKRLSEDCVLAVNMGRTKGTGAYVLDRRAARKLSEGLLPMWLPFDHALDREWFFGLSTVAVIPFPISQTERIFRSSIQGTSQKRLSKGRRILTTYPYQIFNEVSRWIFRGIHLLSIKARS